MTEDTNHLGLLDAKAFLAWMCPNEESRPSLRWLRDRTKRGEIPFIKMGHLVFFEPRQTLQAILEKHTISPRQ